MLIRKSVYPSLFNNIKSLTSFGQLFLLDIRQHNIANPHTDTSLRKTCFLDYLID